MTISEILFAIENVADTKELAQIEETAKRMMTKRRDEVRRQYYQTLNDLIKEIRNSGFEVEADTKIDDEDNTETVWDYTFPIYPDTIHIS